MKTIQGGRLNGMQVEVGSIVEGKVTGITNFGAFVSIPGGQTGMVHISEISNSYVKEIGDFLSNDQEVKVMVLAIADDGKISLSMKRCEPKPAAPEKTEHSRGDRRPPAQNSGAPRSGGGRPPQRRSQSRDVGWQPGKPDNASDLSFEDMMTRFKQVSNDRMGELKRANEPRRSRRGGGGGGSSKG